MSDSPARGVRISVSTRPDAVVVAVAGELDMGSASSLRVELADRLRLKPDGLVLDFGNVAFCASAGLQVLAEAARTASDSGVPFVVASAPPPVVRTFEISRLTAAVTLTRDVDEALSWVRDRRSPRS
ncbi:STAS domain-containing protein [Amycolatopsis sp. OK19-0408]|uniref:Anti-sigma factor antagonist n=1 Tax=Amycolatopsis iheyensis TaxID=2945988 RepID=A0A9X2SJU6_9PSEU|nr:STAS domain-containing protein [Amycolatopsis iheyensis]MCR6483191.1 STAS domain-containing protein [Amycolatopsis iheyensis]